MRAFKGLFMKEIKLSRNWFLIGMALFIIAIFAGLALTRYFNEPEILPIVSIMILVAHGLYLPAFLITSLNTEGQSQLWLHNPNSGVKLFLAKLAAGSVYFLISLLLAMFFAHWQVNLSDHGGGFTQFIEEPFPNMMLMGVAIVLSSIYLGVWVLFYWSFYHSLKKVPIARNFRWPILIGFWILLEVVSNYIQNLPFYKNLKQSGVISLDFMKSIKIEVGDSIGTGKVVEAAEISLTNGIIYAAVVILVFFIAVWLLERKVEV
ncbi:hypothetical protein [Cytobacillus dafuensis]|uniref:Uncharacterized protein n=1 Tax=Cytobacillus dafuensis TaxID=1742359 RepID=A0A5B8ZAV2_CYTDA|nr:hypothetical protein [Cytobacillus dafuensis]QED48749.1 hypothetical protein FSZ17_16645 [Cytobacillus dafuensis]